MQNSKELRQQKFAMIEQWQQCNLSAKAYCLQNNIACSVFQYWLKKYRHSKSAEQRSPSFIELNVSNHSASTVEVVWPDGKRILFHHGVDASYLKSLIG